MADSIDPGKFGDEEAPFWAYPTLSARKAHWFPKMDQPSACRAYFAGMLALMAEAGPWSETCKSCEARAAKATGQASG